MLVSLYFDLCLHAFISSDLLLSVPSFFFIITSFSVKRVQKLNVKFKSHNISITLYT